jgi:hypothetical protein
MMKSVLLLSLFALLPGCLSNVVALNPKAGGVKIVRETDKPLHCDVRGKISGMSRSSDDKEGRNGAENDFRNHAAELEGNFALIEAERSGKIGTGTQKDFYIGGKALFCQTEEMEAEEEKRHAAEVEAKEKAQAESEQAEADTKKAQADAKKSKK